MLTLAAYRLETQQLIEKELESSWLELTIAIDAWLAGKGVEKLAADTGVFTSKTPGATGTFERSNISIESGSLIEVSLIEPTMDGHTFRTNLALTKFDGVIVFYLTLSASNAGDMVAPTSFYPRCPSLIRDILKLRKDWHFGGSEIPPAKEILLVGKKSAETLVEYLLSNTRSLPVTVVSELDGEPIWNELPEKLSNDLAGLSSVVRIDADASWELNNLLGKPRSCYLGAVRIYWPLRADSQDPSELRSKIWTAERLLSSDTDGKGLSRFTTSLRRQVMSIAALSVDAPLQIRKIKREHSHARLAQLEAKADANSEELELARLYIEENETLKDDLESAKKEIAKQSARADAAEYAIEVLKSAEDDDSVDTIDVTEKAYVNEVSFYKKTHSKPSYDVLVRISDCGHNSWQTANKADKATKGIERLEGRLDWKGLYHCGSCQGGGVWKVIW
ncbi:hypothetical protein ACEUBT_10995 [Aeromonas bivalvium]|uniref:hypothetical protein n=1 Tax=Aeromonas bivalvium TaxID=440079 RepID=UPI0038D21598